MMMENENFYKLGRIHDNYGIFLTAISWNWIIIIGDFFLYSQGSKMHHNKFY